MFVEAKAVDEHGEVHLELLQLHIENLDKEIQNIAIKMGKKCLYPKGETLCDRAWWYHNCWKKADPKVSFLGIFEHLACKIMHIHIVSREALFSYLKAGAELQQLGL